MADFLSAAAPRAVFKRYLTSREEKQLLAHVAKHAGLYARRDHAWMRVLRCSGFRLGSLRHMTVADAREALRTRRLRAAAEHAKRGRGYDVPVTSKLELALRDALSVRRAMRLPEDDAAPLFCSRLGQAMAERTYEQRMQMWRKSSGLAVPASPHWWRHTYGKRVMAASEHRDPQQVVQALLGHASRQSTEVYTLPDREDLERDAEAACR